MALDDDDANVPETGAVFTFGRTHFAENKAGKFWLRDDYLVNCDTGDEHSLLVAESGRIFSFGSNEWGQLGLGHTKRVKRPSCLKSLKKWRFKMTASGRANGYAITEGGAVFSWGRHDEGRLGREYDESDQTPREIPAAAFDGKVVALAAGESHVLAVTSGGSLYAWGDGAEGQLGLGSDLSERSRPERVPLANHVVDIACGYYHSAVVTGDGDLLCCGESDCGKLGLGEDVDSTVSKFQRVEGIGERVRQVAAGGKHTIAVTESGRVFSFGEGSSGQLGLGNLCMNCWVPREIPFPDETRISRAECGESHSMLITSSKQLLSFGDARDGKLAHGDDDVANQLFPRYVNRFGKFDVLSVACGGCHTIVIARPGSSHEEVATSTLYVEEGTMSGSTSARTRHHNRLRNSMKKSLPSLTPRLSSFEPHLPTAVPEVNVTHTPIGKTDRHDELNRRVEELDDDEEEDRKNVARKIEEINNLPEEEESENEERLADRKSFRPNAEKRNIFGKKKTGENGRRKKKNLPGKTSSSSEHARRQRGSRTLPAVLSESEDEDEDDGEEEEGEEEEGGVEEEEEENERWQRERKEKLKKERLRKGEKRRAAEHRRDDERIRDQEHWKGEGQMKEKLVGEVEKKKDDKKKSKFCNIL